VQLELDALGILTWIFSLPQGFVPGVQTNPGATPDNGQNNDEQNDEQNNEGDNQEQDQAGDEG
jgi:hypothetical protein